MKKMVFGMMVFILLLTACSPVNNLPVVPVTSSALNTNTAVPSPSQAASTQPALPRVSTSTPAVVNASQGPTGFVPAFDHIVLIMFENQDYESVIGNASMPYFNDLAKHNVLLTRTYSVRHPSLPNYIAVMSGDTQNITSDCTDCFVNAPNLADEITASGRTWKSYMEDMPSPCFLGNSGKYAQKHNPFLYFDSIRQDTTLCQKAIVPLTTLDADLAANQLPNFSFIMPNLCNSGHDCSLDVADGWLKTMVTKLQSSPQLQKNSLIIVTFDEGSEKNNETCCGLGKKGGGRIAAVLISPLAAPGFTDGTEYSLYSILKTILTAWNLPALGKTSLSDILPVTAPWKK